VFAVAGAFPPRPGKLACTPFETGLDAIGGTAFCVRAAPIRPPFFVLKAVGAFIATLAGLLEFPAKTPPMSPPFGKDESIFGWASGATVFCILMSCIL
jgi:hypothetical protein